MVSVCCKIHSALHCHDRFDIYSFGFRESEDEDGLLKTAKSLKQLIESEISSTGIDSKRIILGGFSQGGVMALLTGLTLDQRLAGIASLSCYLPLKSKFKSVGPFPRW